MVNAHPERALALSYAPAAARPAMAVLLSLDDRLGELARVGREPLIAQMRLTWWHDALVALDDAPPPAEPVLTALADDVLPQGVSGALLAGMVEGWEALLDGEPADPATREAHARQRGRLLFLAAAHALDGQEEVGSVAVAGEGWALADLARRTGSGEARAEALRRLDGTFRRRWPRRLRALGALAISARFDAAGRPAPGHPRRVARLALHRLTGH